jgi:uncharacterized Zn finger protein
VAKRREKANRLVKKLSKDRPLSPCQIVGGKIANSFWGKGWCDHFDRQADYDNRLPRGRSYVKNGAVIHLDISEGEVSALVSGSSLYEVEMKIKPLSAAKWENIKERCRGYISSLVEILQGQLSKEIMGVVSHAHDGLFPLASEISYSCSCPDWASLCKHVAAVFYGIGNRLDYEPELLFLLRGLDPSELLDAGVDRLKAIDGKGDDDFLGDSLEEIFGLKLDSVEPLGEESEGSKKAAGRPKKAALKEALSPEKGQAKAQKAEISLVKPPPKPEPSVSPQGRQKAAELRPLAEESSPPPKRGRGRPPKNPSLAQALSPVAEVKVAEVKVAEIKVAEVKAAEIKAPKDRDEDLAPRKRGRPKRAI